MIKSCCMLVHLLERASRRESEFNSQSFSSLMESAFGTMGAAFWGVYIMGGHPHPLEWSC